jgi:hypothetical protein
MILYQKPYVTIEQDKQLKCLIQNWKGFATSANFRDAINVSLKLFDQGDFEKIISNTKDFSLVKKEDTDWVAQVVTPQMVKHGLRYMAFIVPTNVFTQITVDNFKEEANKVVSIRYFDNLDAATAWFRNVDSEKNSISA